MRIEEDLKLGFKDVLIRPKRSTLKSRSDVELERQFTFKHSGQRWRMVIPNTSCSSLRKRVKRGRPKPFVLAT